MFVVPIRFWREDALAASVHRAPEGEPPQIYLVQLQPFSVKIKLSSLGYVRPWRRAHLLDTYTIVRH